MTKNTGRRSEDRLADMGVEPTPEVYDHPACDDCTVPVDHDLPLGESLILHDHQRHCRGRIVHFSIQLTLVDNGEKHILARTDTSHGTVHTHFFARDTVEEKVELSTIPVDNGPEFLDDAHVDAFEGMIDSASRLKEGW